MTPRRIGGSVPGLVPPSKLSPTLNNQVHQKQEPNQKLLKKTELSIGLVRFTAFRRGCAHPWHRCSAFDVICGLVLLQSYAAAMAGDVFFPLFISLD